MAWMRRQETYEMQTVEMTKEGVRWWKTHEITPHVSIRWQASMAWMRRQETYEMQTVEMTKKRVRWWTHEMTLHVSIRW